MRELLLNLAAASIALGVLWSMAKAARKVIEREFRIFELACMLEPHEDDEPHKSTPPQPDP